MADQPYDELGRLLSSGFDIALAIAFFNDYPQDRIDAIILRYASGVSAGVVDQVIQLAEQEVSAGEYLSGLGPDDAVDYDQIPINPYLFGDEAAGRRFFSASNVTIGESGQEYRLDIEWPDIPNFNEYAQGLQQLVEEYALDSPKWSQLLEDAGETISSSVAMVAVRRF